MSGNQLRFYLPPESKNKDYFLSKDPTFCHQLRNVLRLRIDQKIIVFTGDNHEYLCRVTDLEPKKFTGQIIQDNKGKTDSKCQIHLFQALPRKDSKMELIVEKCTELGVKSITPVITAHSLKKSPGKIHRLQKIIIEATEQSGRITIPELNQVEELPIALQKAPGKTVALDQAGKTSLYQIVNQSKSVELSLFIGPEGGFSEDEIKLFQENKVEIASLGDNILRTETAAIASLAISGIFLCQK